MKALKILLIEDDLGDISLFRELVEELEALPYSRLLKRSAQLEVIDVVDDALELIRSDEYNLILFSMAPKRGRGFSDFLALYAEVPDIPCVVVADRCDESLALVAVREGAQDYLLKTDVDCAALARALRYADEKCRMTAALRNLSPADDLTGLYNRGAFLTLMDHDLQIISSLGNSASVVLVRFDGIEAIASREKRELLLLDLAESFREAVPECALAGRTADYDFAFLLSGTCTGAAAAERLRRSLDCWRSACGHSISTRFVAIPAQNSCAEQVLASAEQRLWETKGYR
jgi:two-component system, cell cycle response regulator